MLISEVAIRRPVFTVMVLGAMVVFGFVSLRRLTIELFPKVDFPMITVTTKLPGADPETIETRVTDKIEEAASTISGLKQVRSTSADSFSQVVVEFQLEKNANVAFEEIQANLNTVRQNLPKDIEEPIIQKMDPDASPIITLVVSANLSTRELSHLADKTIKERLQRVRDVGSVKLAGKRDRKIWLWLNPEKMKRHAISVQDVETALQQAHVEQPGGRVETGPIELTTRTKAEFENAGAMSELIVKRSATQIVRLRDIGFAEDGLEEERSYAQLDDKPCIALQIRRQSGTNTVQVANDIKAEIERLRQELTPRGVRLEITQDSSVYVQHSVDEVETHLIVGGGMAILTVLLFLMNWGSTFISSMVLPTSVMSTFLLINAMGYSLNMMTLLGLTLAIGLLIDDAIVVQENIMRHVQAGKPAHVAAGFATSEIGLAVLATTLSVVAVFLPVTMMRGIVGRFMLPFAMTVSFAVLISMFVSFTLDPMLSARILKKPGRQNFVFRVLERLFEGLEWVYGRMLGFTLQNRWLVVCFGAGIMVLAAYLAKYVKTEFIPVEDRGEANVMIRAPQGASLARSRELANRIREKLKDIPEIKYTFFSVGADDMEKVNETTLYLRFSDKHQRTRSQAQLMTAVRERLAGITDALVSVQAVDEMQGGGMKSAQIQWEIRGPNLRQLEITSNAIIARMQKTGFADVQNSYEPNKPEADVVVDRVRAAQLGVECSDIANTLRAAIGGLDVAKFKAEGDRYDIAVRFLEEFRNQPDLIAGLWVPAGNGELIELRNVAKVVRTGIPVEITRYNRQRDVTVLANFGPGMVMGPAMEEVEKITHDVGLPPGYTAGWAGMAQNMREDFGYMFETMVLSVIVVFMVLAAQFESLVHPFTILLSLPLAFVGAFAALEIFRMNISIFTMIAFIFLLGLVTKNAILLIDYTNTLRERDGMARDVALQRAGPVRLRPILMTTVAMIAGMLPTALGTGSGSESRQPMAVAIIGGLITSTLLTLLVVPAVYSLLDPMSEYMKHKFLTLRRRNPEKEIVTVSEEVACVEGKEQ